jgi:hypothetical protein
LGAAGECRSGISDQRGEEITVVGEQLRDGEEVAGDDGELGLEGGPEERGWWVRDLDIIFHPFTFFLSSFILLFTNYY